MRQVHYAKVFDLILYHITLIQKNILNFVNSSFFLSIESKEKLTHSLSDAKLEFNFDPKQIKIGMTNTAQAAAEVVRDLEARKRFLEAIITLTKRFLSLLFIKVIVNAMDYRSKYLEDIEHDNVYVTSYFRKIDARRRARGSFTLLPLKKLEKIKLVDPYDMRQTKAERRNIVGQTAKLLLEIITASIVVLLDRVLYEVLVIVHKNSRLDITQVKFV